MEKLKKFIREIEKAELKRIYTELFANRAYTKEEYLAKIKELDEE